MTSSAPAGAATRPWLTVGVPTRDRPAELSGLLELVRAEAAGLRVRWQVELLVADGSAVPPALPAELLEAVDAGRVVPVDGGVSRGRNLLAQQARGEVLVLVDDDVRPAPGAIGLLAAAVASGTAVAGAVAGLGHRPGERSRLGRVTRDGYGAPVRATGDPDYAVSALLALPRDVFTAVAWDERFSAAHLDDVMYGLRLRAAGVRLVECAAATAEHPPRRDGKDTPELAGARAVVVLTRWAGDRLATAWLRCLAHVAWTHRRRPSDLRVAVGGYLAATRAWRAAR